jgi:hypothetical protein
MRVAAPITRMLTAFLLNESAYRMQTIGKIKFVPVVASSTHHNSLEMINSE